jgi:hypothetical protein
LTLQVKDRPGVPDEARTSIAVVTKGGTAAKVTKWASEKHPDFDTVYGYLRAICSRTEAGKPIYAGVYDWEWRPVGFDHAW